ncbi:MAG: ThiF family adenylyltransferase [Pseudomonadota bacterium]
MITIPSEYLNVNWKKLNDNKVLPCIFSEWDEGDAYSLNSLGIFQNPKEVYGAVVIGETNSSEYFLVVQLIQVDDTKKYDYIAPSGDKYKVVSYINKGPEEKEEIKTCIVDIGHELSARQRGFIETNLLKDTSVLIFGLGTGGIHISIDLVKCGVGNFHLVDPDRLEVGNICRHQAGLSHIGRKKVVVARDLLLEKNPKVKVSTYPIKADEQNRTKLLEIAKSVDLIICATDNRESKLLINRIGLEQKKTMFFPGAFRRAYGGQILRVYPTETACYHCFLLGMPDVETDQEVSSNTNASDIAYSDRNVPVEPGLSIDVEPIGTMTSKLALQELIKNKDSTLHILDKDLSANWYFWINRPEPNTQYASWPPLSDEATAMTVLRWYGVDFCKDEECPACGNFEGALRKQYGLEPNEDAFPESSVLPTDIQIKED